MIRRLLAALPLLFATAAAAGPYLVEFEGAITEIDARAPDGFWIGERVVGGFVYDPDTPVWTIRSYSTPRSTQPIAEFGTVFQIAMSGPVAVGAEGGTSVSVAGSNLVWIGNYYVTTSGDVDVLDAPTLRIGSGGTLETLIPPDLLARETIESLAGPTVSGLQIDILPHSELPPFTWSDGGLSIAGLATLATPSHLSLTGGSFVFPDAASSSWPFPTPPITVSFSVDNVRVRAIPEPSVTMLLASGFALTQIRLRGDC